MAASYPTSPVSFTRKIDLTDLVIASDVNSAYDEIEAIEQALGNTPSKVTTWTGTPDFTSPKDWGSVSARIGNVELTSYKAYQERVSINGGSTITASSTSVVALTLKPNTNLQSANILEVKNAAGSANILTINATGTLQAVAIDGGTA